MTSVLEQTDTDRRPTTGPGDVAHIIDQRASSGQDTTTAYIEGTPLVALCGHTWVPSKSPKNLPVCSKCIAKHERIGGKPYEV